MKTFLARPLRILPLAALLLGLAAQPVRAAFVIDSLDGDITQNEINNFISTINAMAVPVNNYGNNMSTHGTEVEGMRRMYEATGNIAILNRMIVFADVALVHRNDEPLGEGRPMWTGNVEPIWPQSATTDQSGCESAQVAGNIAYVAKLILRNPSIWNTTVPDGNPYGYGATYRQRALTYVAKVDETLGEYFTVWFVNPTTFRIRKPTDPRWVNAAETSWNRQALTMMGYQNAAQCHELLGDNPTLLQFYKNVCNAFANWFVATYPSGGSVYYTSGGRTVAKWYYEIPNDQHIENIGHAQHEIVQLYQLYEAGFGAPTSAQLKVYADTTQFIINKGATNLWAGNVDGTGTTSSSLKTDFIFLGSQWNRPLYKMIGQSNRDANTLNGSEGCKNTGYILWMKRWVFQQSAPDFTLVATPTSRSVNAGSSTTYTVTITGTNSFNGSVALAAAGLPAGATASFSPSSITGSGTSTLTVTTSGSTPPNTSTLTITGTSGSLSHSDTVSLSVMDYTVSATPSSRTVTAGGSTTYTVNVGNQNGFSGTVTFSATGVPTGASASFNPTSVNGLGSSTMTVTTGGSTPTGNHTLTVRGTSGSMLHTAPVTLTVNPAGGPLPTGWTSQDIGAVGIAGSASFNSGTFTVTGSGADIWSTADEFHYAHQAGSGNFTITARVATQQKPHAWAKSGVMIRESTAAGSAHAAVYVSASNGVSMQIRPATGASSINLSTVAGFAAPYWVRLTRSGNTFSGFRSADGVTWTPVASTNITMATSTRAGLAVSSHNDAVLATSTFDNVTVTTPPSCVSVAATGTWTNRSMATQTGTFTSTFDVTPSISPISSAVGLSQGAQTAFTGFACAVVFTTAGTIQARNGGVYAADNVINSAPGVTYHFRLVVNVPAHTYSIFVTPAGGSELTVGSNYAFRTEQNTVTSLNSWGALVNASPGGTMSVCGFTP